MYLYLVGVAACQQHQLAECMINANLVCTVLNKRATASFALELSSCCLLLSGGVVRALEDTGGIPHLHYSQMPSASAPAVCCSHRHGRSRDPLSGAQAHSWYTPHFLYTQHLRLISAYLMSAYLNSTHLISAHLISSHLISPTCPQNTSYNLNHQL